MMHCPRNKDGKLPVYQAAKTIVMKDRAETQVQQLQQLEVVMTDVIIYRPSP